MADTTASSPIKPSQEFKRPTGGNPQIDYTFYLEMKPLRKLKLAIDALVDPFFPKDESRVMEVDEHGFRFLVLTDNKVSAYFRLLPSGSNIISFRCYQPINGDKVSLGFISGWFPNGLDVDDESVSIFHVRGSSLLCFKFGTTSPRELRSEFSVCAPVKMIPDFTIFCRTIIPTNDLRQMIAYTRPPLVENSPGATTVGVEISADFAKFGIRSAREWEYKASDDYEQDWGVIKKLKPGQTEIVCFEWTNAGFMYKASFLQSSCIVYFLSAPVGRILFVFREEGLGDFVIVQDAYVTGMKVERTP